MPTFNGNFVSPVVVPVAASFGLSVNLDDYEALFNTVGLTSSDIAGDFTDEAPISLVSEALDGNLARTVKDLYYYRIWIVPAIVNLGRIVSEAHHQVEVWNSFFEPRDFGPIVITGDDSGLSLDGDASGTFNYLESQLRTLTSDPEGAQRVDVEYDFVFQGTGDVGSVLQVLGIRIVVFLLRHNWLSTVLEQIAFKTDVLTGLSGVEQRRKLRQSPRRRLEMSYLTLTKQERMYLENATYNQNTVFAVPLWSDVGTLRTNAIAGTQTFDVDTRGRDYEVGGMVFIQKDTDVCESMAIESFTDDSITTVEPCINSYTAGARVCPARFGLLEGKQSIKRHTNEIDDTRLAWLIDSDSDALNRLETYTPDTYLDLEVYDEQNDYSSELGIEQEARREMMDNDIGLIETLTVEPFPRRTYPFTKLMLRDELPAYLQWFYNRSGKWVPFWWVDRVQHFQLTDEVSFDSITMTVKTFGYAEFMFANPSRRYIAIANGTDWIYRTIVDAEIQEDGNTLLTLDTAPGIDLDPDDDPMICLLRKVRLDSDMLELTYETSTVIRSATRFIDVF